MLVVFVTSGSQPAGCQFLEKKLSDESTKQGFTDWLKSTFVEALMAASD